MQTFLPYPDFQKTVECLDYKRLGKQRVEAFQILKAINDPNYSWRKHPIVKMWLNYEDALKLYMNTCIKEWINRGYNNTMKIEKVKNKIKYPSWLGNKKLHASHRSNLLRKEPNYYSKFGWKEPNNLDYVWII